MQVDTRKLRNIQRGIAGEAQLKDVIKKDEITKIAGFDVTFFGDKVICAAIVLDFKTLQVIERKYTVGKVPMQYIPGYEAFREGPIILETYYSLEEEPDILIIDGHGATHPLKAGLATYVGVELTKPCIGVAQKLMVGDIREDKIFILEQLRGLVVKTKEHANPLFVSAGNFISMETAAEIISKIVVPPHKLPEPIHQAHKYAKKIAEQLKENKELPQETTSEQGPMMEEFDLNEEVNSEEGISEGV